MEVFPCLKAMYVPVPVYVEKFTVYCAQVDDEGIVTVVNAVNVAAFPGSVMVPTITG